MEIYGVYSITNCFTLLIIDIKHTIEDCVKVALYDGEAYFIKYNRRYYLKDIERVM